MSGRGSRDVDAGKKRREMFDFCFLFLLDEVWLRIYRHRPSQRIYMGTSGQLPRLVLPPNSLSLSLLTLFIIRTIPSHFRPRHIVKRQSSMEEI